MKKFYIKKQGHGKFRYYKVHQVKSEEHLIELKENGAKIFNSRSEAIRHAQRMK